MKKPILSITRNPNLGTTIVFRSLIRRQWLFNVSLSKKGTGSISVTLLALIASIFYACVSSPDTDSKPKTHYVHAADTLWHDDMNEWNAGRLDRTEYSVGIEWSTATIVMSDSLTSWTIGTVSYAKAYQTSPKPVYWNGTAIVIDWDKLPANWWNVTIKFSKKEVE